MRLLLLLLMLLMPCNLLLACLHQRLVLGDAQSLTIDNTRAFRLGPVPVVRVILHVLFAESRLLLVVRLLLRIRQRLPLGAYVIQYSEATVTVTRG